MSDGRCRIRCAIYTRKSSEEGLDQQFNSLDAQRAACEAYVLSQAGEGWAASAELYDDAGWSGGNMERPALKRLLEQIRGGRIDVVVVYKVDRLTRSLMDFAHIVEAFDTNGVSFVSVTQAFNTTTSMGRLTLNVLLSFAQFEREVTGERIRDKIAASKARGIWMGGNVPLGYDLGDRRLIPNQIEAETVRLIFSRYIELGSVVVLAHELDRLRVRSKKWVSSRGREHGGRQFSPGALAHILNNRTYLGEICHKGAVYAGEHDAIVTKEVFDAAQAMLASHRVQRTRRKSVTAIGPLTGKIFDQDGSPMRPTFSYGRNSRIYRYYVGDGPGSKIGHNAASSRKNRVSAERLENLIAQAVKNLLACPPSSEVLHAVVRADLSSHWLKLTVDLEALKSTDPDFAAARARKLDPTSSVTATILTLTIDARAARQGRTKNTGIDAVAPSSRQSYIVRLLRSAHKTLVELNASPLATDCHRMMQAPKDNWARKRAAIGLLSPALQKDLLAGKISTNAVNRLLHGQVPLCWSEQASFVKSLNIIEHSA